MFPLKLQEIRIPCITFARTHKVKNSMNSLTAGKVYYRGHGLKRIPKGEYLHFFPKEYRRSDCPKMKYHTNVKCSTLWQMTVIVASSFCVLFCLFFWCKLPFCCLNVVWHMPFSFNTTKADLKTCRLDTFILIIFPQDFQWPSKNTSLFNLTLNSHFSQLRTLSYDACGKCGEHQQSF